MFECGFQNQGRLVSVVSCACKKWQMDKLKVLGINLYGVGHEYEVTRRFTEVTVDILPCVS